MTVTAALPAKKSNLVIRPFGKSGEYVVKNPQVGTYLKIGEQEYFLLLQLDGKRSEADVLEAFNDKFSDPLSSDDLQGFVEMASQRKLLNDGRTAAAAE